MPMRNKMLAIFNEHIPYLKQLRPIIGSVLSTILMQQLEYRFALFQDGFYKFLEPVDHPAYRPGDSMTEELGFSKDEFRTAFDKIGIRYKSKAEFTEAAIHGNPYKKDDKEYFYCSYYDRIKNMTYYFRNHDLVDTVLDELAKQPLSKPAHVMTQQENMIHQHLPRIPSTNEPESHDPTTDFRKSAFPISSKSTMPTSVNRQSPLTEMGDLDLRKLGLPTSVNRGLQSTEMGNANFDYTKITYKEDTKEYYKKEQHHQHHQAAPALFSLKPLQGEAVNAALSTNLTDLVNDLLGKAAQLDQEASTQAINPDQNRTSRHHLILETFLHLTGRYPTPLLLSGLVDSPQPTEVVVEAIVRSASKDKPDEYAIRLVKEWYSKGINTYDCIVEADQQYHQTKQKRHIKRA